METFENSPAFFAVLLIVFPILFATIGCFVLAITSRMSGWHTLLKLYPYKGEQAVQWQSRGAGGVYRESLPFAGARGGYAIGAAKHGLIVKSPLMIRPIYRSLFLPYDKVQNETDKTIILDFVMLEMQGAPDVRVGVLKSARDMAEGVRG